MDSLRNAALEVGPAIELTAAAGRERAEFVHNSTRSDPKRQVTLVEGSRAEVRRRAVNRSRNIQCIWAISCDSRGLLIHPTMKKNRGKP